MARNELLEDTTAPELEAPETDLEELEAPEADLDDCGDAEVDDDLDNLSSDLDRWPGEEDDDFFGGGYSDRDFIYGLLR